MAVIEVTLPSGYVADQDALMDLRKDENVKLVETKDQDTVLVMYFDKVRASVTLFTAGNQLRQNSGRKIMVICKGIYCVWFRGLRTYECKD